MKRILALVLGLVMVLGLFVGCTDTTTEKSANKSEAAATSEATTTNDSAITDEEITITYQTGSATDMFTSAFAVYQEDHPNVTLDVQVTDTDGYNTKLLAQCESNTNPDVTWWNGLMYVGSWDTGAFLDLTDIVNEQFTDRFVDGTFSLSETADGAICCFPCEMQIQGFLINTSLFTKYGLDIPETFDDLINCAEVFSANGVYLFGNGTADTFPVWGWMHWFELWGLEEEAEDLYTAHELSFADSDASTALYKLIELREAGAFPENNSTITYDMTVTSFLNEECACMTTSTDWLSGIVGSDLDKSGVIEYWFGVTFDDSPYNQNTCVKMVGNGYGISSQISDEKLAVLLDFFDWFYSDECANLLLADSGIVLPIDFEVTADISPLAASIIDLTLNTTRTATVQYYVIPRRIWGYNTDIVGPTMTTVKTMINGCIDGSITRDDITEYFAEYDDKIDAAIADYAAIQG